MDQSLDQQVRHRAEMRCEYCHVAEAASRLPHVLDHIIARQHGGTTASDNLALCCGRCNQFKGPNIASIDWETSALTPLFHPRHDHWGHHFGWEGAVLIGKTAVGRVTVAVLSINHPPRIAARMALIVEGVFPPVND